MIRYAKPKDVDEALALLATSPWRVLAGATDFYPALGNRPLDENILDINGLDELRGIYRSGDGFAIGARTIWTDIIAAALPPAFDALKQAAREVGSVQIQNVGTIAGNLCNASPAADGVPALLILDAEVELRSARGIRRLPLGDFILGNRRTARATDELVTAIHVPATSTLGASAFHKLGSRRYLVISIAMAAVRLEMEVGRIASASIAVGACSPVARRLPAVETALVGRRPGREAAEAMAAADFSVLDPIDDVRGSAGYRRDAAREIGLRAVESLIGTPLTVAA